MNPEIEPSHEELLAMSQNMHLQSPEELRRNLDRLLAALPDDVRQQFLQHEIDARARPVTAPLESMTGAQLQALGGEALDMAVCDYVAGQLQDVGDGQAALRGLPVVLQVFFLSCLVQNETLNGGLAQFFWNSSGDFGEQIAPALRAIGASDAASLFEQALEVARSEASQRDGLRLDGSWDAFVQYKSESFLRTFDGAFCPLAAKLPEQRAAYFSANQTQFILSRS